MYHNFEYDFSNIYFVRMRLKVASLPNFREILNTRHRFLNNKIKKLKEIEQAKKLLNKKQLKYYEEKEKEAIITKSVGQYSFDVKAIQERNKQKLERR